VVRKKGRRNIIIQRNGIRKARERKDSTGGVFIGKNGAMKRPETWVNGWARRGVAQVKGRVQVKEARNCGSSK